MKVLMMVFLMAALLVNGEALAAKPQKQKVPAEVVTWETPDWKEKNDSFSVWVRGDGKKAWKELYVYNVKNGEQKEQDVPTDAAMVNLDFTGTVEFKVTYHPAEIKEFEIRPSSYPINARKKGKHILYFTLTQDDKAPLKPTIMVNGSWSEGNLHILSNTPEKDAPSPDAENVYVVHPGDPVPLYLPAGKNTYYFTPGEHELPKGMWVELDLGDVFQLEKFDFVQPLTDSQWFAKGPQRFLIEAKEKAEDPYVQIYDGRENRMEGTVTDILKNVKARYVKLTLLGNTGSSHYVMASIASEFRLYKNGDSTNIAKGKAVRGAFPGYEKVVDGNESTFYMSSTGYGNWHAGEAFYVSQSDTTVYLAPGSVVKGAISADDRNNITIRGRGILYGGDLLRPRTYAEGRSGAIWITKSANSKLEGITLIDYPMWSVVMNFTDQTTIQNINFFGSMVNADGIHLSGSKNARVSGVFIRTTDDNLVMYHYGETSNITVKDSIFWADNARPILLGLGTTPNASIDQVSFENIHILNQRGVWDLNKYNGAIQLWATGGNKISNVRFKNIRIDEFEVPEDSMLFQIKTDEFVPGVPLGSVSGITFEDVFYRGKLPRKSLIHGVDDLHNVRDIRFTNVKLNGTELSKNNMEAYIEAKGQYGDLTFE
ncbi:glycosyl hydrolase family 28 protein [Paenibacillus sp. MBLB4367]|uniref:glycosyl hydrolase family 28 protein n=1 Tax=Paenibacillus sp. MBLB4367 TaxID=3384767 RepID=UPI003907FA23